MEHVIPLIPTQSTHRSIEKGATVLYQGEIPQQAYIVQSGAIKAYRLSRTGEEQIVGFRMPGDIFPETWIFDKTPNALYYYAAMEDSDVVTVERQVLLDHIYSNPSLERSVLDYFINSYTGHILQIAALEQSRAADKVILMLHYLLLRYGKQTVKDQYEIPFHLTHTMLGNLTGLTRETTTVELGKLRRKKVIDYNGIRFTIYKDALVRMLTKESLADIQL